MVNDGGDDLSCQNLVRVVAVVKMRNRGFMGDT